MKSHARVVIVGGGIMGVGLAYHLAEEGWSDLVIIEKAELTSGSTWHAAGQCPSFIGSYNMAKIHHYSNTLYPKLEEITGQYVSWHGCGGIRLALTDEEVNWFKRVKTFAPNIGFDLEVITPEEIKQRVPYINLDNVKAGALTTIDGHVDPAGLCNALAIGAKQMGAIIERHTLVSDIKLLASGEWEIITDKGTIICEHVVNAAGCYARQVGEWVGVDVPITNMVHHYIVTEPLQEFLDSDEEMPVIRDPHASAYLRQEQKSGLMGIYENISTEAWSHRGGWPEWDSENELFEPDFDRIGPWIERCMDRIPIFNTGLKRTVCGAISHTPDSNPLLGPAGGLKNFWMCTGASIGIAQGGGAGKYMAQMMVHGDSEINMLEFDPRRFGKFADQDYTRKMSFEDYSMMYSPGLVGEERPAARGARTTPLYEKLKAQGCVYTKVFGWERPKWFSTDGREENYSFRRNNVFDLVGKEVKAVRERVGVLDLSSFSKFEVSGLDAEEFLKYMCANRIPKKTGGSVLAHMLSEGGRIRSEITITRLQDDLFYILAAGAAEVHDMDQFTRDTGRSFDVEIKNVTDEYGVLVVSGPRSRDLLNKLTEADLSTESFRWLTGQKIEVAGIPLRALRISYVGELGWELHCPMRELEKLYDAVWQAGEEFGIANYGVYAVNSMRMEKAYRGWGTELTAEITLVEADMERFVRYDKDFIGKTPMLNIKQQGHAIQLVYCEVDAKDADVIGGEAVIKDGKCVGLVTSGGYGHHVGKSLAFAYVTPELAAAGTEFEIQILDDTLKARVLAAPAYDPESKRMRV